MQRTHFLVAVAAALVGLAACRADIRAADYDQTCVVDTDCIAIEEGDVCQSCGAVSAAVNIAEGAQVTADRNARAEQCLPWEAIDSDCFCNNVTVVGCVEGQCSLLQSPCAPIIQPPSFLVASPDLNRPIPPNAQVRGQRVGGVDESSPIAARLDTIDADGLTTSRPLPFTTDHCAEINGCEQRLALAPLVPGTGSILVVTVEGEEITFPLTVGADVDTTPPVLAGFGVEQEGVQGSRQDDGSLDFETTVQFTTPAVDDDTGLAGIALARRVDGARLVLIERQQAADVILVDTVGENEGTEACYSVIAWDIAGNEAATAESCVDIVIDDDEKPLACGAGAGGLWPVLVLLSRHRRRRR